MEVLAVTENLRFLSVKHLQRVSSTVVFIPADSCYNLHSLRRCVPFGMEERSMVPHQREEQAGSPQTTQRHSRIHWTVISIAVIASIAFAFTAILILINEGISHGAITLTILSIIFGVVIFSLPCELAGSRVTTMPRSMARAAAWSTSCV